MRILWQSAAPFVHTGYGTQAASLLPRLKRAGHAVTAFAQFGLQAGRGSYAGVPVVAGNSDPFGNDIVVEHYAALKADLLLTMVDTWALNEYGRKGMRWCPWTPIDHDPVPRKVLDSLRGAHDVLAFSEFGLRELTGSGVEARLIPLGVESEVFKPLGATEAIRRRMGLDEYAFVVGFVGLNDRYPCRKGQDRALEAFARFHGRHLESVLYMHTSARPSPGGIDLAGYAEVLGVGGCTRFADPYQYRIGLSAGRMAQTYNCMDVLVAPSTGEGFGLPIVEAQACGTPVIVTDFTSMGELCGAGWKVRPSDTFVTPLLSYQALPSVDGIAEALEMAWERKGDACLREQAAEFGRRFDWDGLFAKAWIPWLNEMEARLGASRGTARKGAA